jgi:Cu(I)/Ag(I) efflux system membrane protein CusA/SilA
VLVTTPSGANVPMTDLADIRMKTGPSMIRDESGLLAGYVFIDTADSDIGGFVQRAKNAVDQQMQLPAGNTLVWSGQFENMIRVRQRLKVVIPLTLFLIFMLLYANTKSVIKTLIVLLAVPFSLIGAVWFLYFLNYNISIGVWVGMIALMGLDAETGVFMLLYLDLAYHDAESKGKLKTSEDLTEAIVHGAVKRVRPKLMTVATALMGLLPIMWSMSLGADMMKRIAAPMIGGLVTSFILELLIYPPLYALWKEKTWKATGENA